MKTSRLYLYNIIVRLLPETRFFGFKCRFLRWCGATVGDHVRVGSSVVVCGTGNLVIGNDVWIGARTFIQAAADASVVIGSCVDIAPCVRIITGSHVIDAVGKHMAGDGYSSSVEIGSGCWIGASSMLLPGVKLAPRTVVAAGGVVSESIEESGCLVAGVPARIKKHY